MLETPFTKLVGIAAPVQLAAMPGVVTPELAAAVSNAGGLGMIGTPLIPPPLLTGMLDRLDGLTKRPYGVNFLMPFLDRGCLAIAASRARVVEFFYGDPDPELVAAARDGGAIAGWQVGSRDEGMQAVDAGCDYLVAQGTAAGGHVRGKIGLLPLLSQLLGAVQVPVVAAGGIANARDLAAVLAAGAAGARVGTRFVASKESGAHPRYVEAILEAGAEDTVLTDAFSVMWPDAPHRVLRSSLEAARAFRGEVTGETEFAGRSMPIPKLAVMAPTKETTGAIEAMALYAGESAGSVTHVEPAAEIVRDLVEGAARLLRGHGAR